MRFMPSGTMIAGMLDALNAARSDCTIDYETGIIGAGFGGILAALELKRAGRNSFAVFERSQEPGGVWRDNTYPGCACDIRSHLYSIATEPNPSWSSDFASQAEILQYLKDVLVRNELQGQIRYGVEIVRARFLEAWGCWQLTDQARKLYHVRTLIFAPGSHNRAVIPAIPGLETFHGEMFHSSAWKPAVALEGRRVAVVGLGASAVQIVPSIASTVAKLDVFQRTPAWVLPRFNRNITRIERWLFRHFPAVQALVRGIIYWILELTGVAFHGNDFLNWLMTQVALLKLAMQVRDPSVRKRLTPTYKLGCKRVLLSDDFYPAFNRSNVTLHSESIIEINADGIVTDDGAFHPADLIVFATGFLVTDMAGYMRIEGRGGRVLNEEWDRDGMEAYRGVHVSGYPNLAILMGPNSGLGHSSVIHVMESQMNYILKWLEELDKADPSAYFDVRSDRQRTYNEDLQHKLAKTVWASGCSSWYLDRNGRNSTVFPGLTRAYRKATARFHRDDYELVEPAT